MTTQLFVTPLMRRIGRGQDGNDGFHGTYGLISLDKHLRDKGVSTTTENSFYHGPQPFRLNYVSDLCPSPTLHI